MTAWRALGWYLGGHIGLALFLWLRCRDCGGTLRLEVKPVDAWIGAFGRRERSTAYQDGTVHVWQLVVPCLPIHWVLPGRLRSHLRVSIGADVSQATVALAEMQAALATLERLGVVRIFRTYGPQEEEA